MSAAVDTHRTCQGGLPSLLQPARPTCCGTLLLLLLTAARGGRQDRQLGAGWGRGAAGGGGHVGLHLSIQQPAQGEEGSHVHQAGTANRILVGWCQLGTSGKGQRSKRRQYRNAVHACSTSRQYTKAHPPDLGLVQGDVVQAQVGQLPIKVAIAWVVRAHAQHDGAVKQDGVAAVDLRAADGGVRAGGQAGECGVGWSCCLRSAGPNSFHPKPRLAHG